MGDLESVYKSIILDVTTTRERATSATLDVLKVCHCLSWRIDACKS